MPKHPILHPESIQQLHAHVQRLEQRIGNTERRVRAWQSDLQTPLKPFCRCTLDEALTTGDADAAATITEQIGYGIEHEDTAITVENQPRQDGTYEYYADSGDYLLAAYTGEGTTWAIIIPECP